MKRKREIMDAIQSYSEGRLLQGREKHAALTHPIKLSAKAPTDTKAPWDSSSGDWLCSAPKCLKGQILQEF